jgi:hypothetical protein
MSQKKKASLERCDTPQSCRNTVKHSQVLASGGFGRVTKYGDKAIKLIRNPTTCQEAGEEYRLMKRLYSFFVTARKRATHPNVRAALRHLQPLKPIAHWKQPFETEGESFSCGVVSQLVQGMSARKLRQWDTSHQLLSEQARFFPRILVMPSQSMPRSSLSLMNAREPLSMQNPPRYFVMSMEDVQRVYRKISFKTDFSYMMGVLLALTTFLAKITLIDVEIVLGSRARKVYIMDLGMCKPLQTTSAEEIAEQLTDLGGPFYTKDVFPSDNSSKAFRYFRKGFLEAARDFNVDIQFAQQIIQLVADNL